MKDKIVVEKLLQLILLPQPPAPHANNQSEYYGSSMMCSALLIPLTNADVIHLMKCYFKPNLFVFSTL